MYAWSHGSDSTFIHYGVVSDILYFLPPLQAVSAISDIRKDIPIHLELASMTDKDYMNRIMQEVHENGCVLRSIFHTTYFYPVLFFGVRLSRHT